jgi:hypothetical protein
MKLLSLLPPFPSVQETEPAEIAHNPTISTESRDIGPTATLLTNSD